MLAGCAGAAKLKDPKELPLLPLPTLLVVVLPKVEAGAGAGAGVVGRDVAGEAEADFFPGRPLIL